MAGLILTMRNADVDAFMSLDSGILNPDLDGIPGNSPHYDPSALRVPWMHSTSTVTHPSPDPAGAESLFAQAVHANRYLLLSQVMEHVDFTSYALVEERSAIVGYWEAATPERVASHRIVARYVYEFFSAFLDQNSESLLALSQDPEESFPGASITLEHRAATPAPIGYDEFVQQVVGGQGSDAVDELRSLAAVEPNHMLLEEPYLRRLAFSLLFTWGLAEEVMPMIEFVIDLYPSSGNFRPLLGEANILLENYPAAIEVYSRHLEQYPNDPWGQSRLEWLRSQ